MIEGNLQSMTLTGHIESKKKVACNEFVQMQNGK